ncbi:DNA-binding GntR family transcriptional regulator [Spinactinospora alkalitolerans]|uniref:DNA-binding GntR family transcriptional regulator n=1 Tax=Spinactinospora alkalitolerans TaxID=687207 RepID=A0A852U836_9ACTN|nr:GntR family transcriptional regulator [Spinactinospora alkalitolerans]NYE50090.1 DNA-binding GntR family transcriptional regulator [Spinactinospora alkalitolerans]
MPPGARTKADHAYQVLRKMIVTGEIPAGEPIDEAALMAIVESGRTPVRESLKRLEQEQFVVWPPHKTPYVRSMSLDDVHRLYEARMLMEVPAASLAASRATSGQIQLIQQRQEELRRAAEVGDVYGSIEADHALHIAITEGSNNKFLTEAVDRLNCRSLRLWYVAHERVGVEKAAERHQEIIDALRKNAPESTARAVRDHIRTSYERQIKINFETLVDPSTNIGRLSLELAAPSDEKGSTRAESATRLCQ